MIIAFDPALLSSPDGLAAGEAVLDAITGQGARLPGARRHAARQRNLREGIPVRMALYNHLRDMMGEE